MKIELPLDGRQRSRLRPVSKALFHSDYALEAFLLILNEEQFFSGQVAEVVGCQANYAGIFVKRLQKAGLVEALPREAGQRRHYFRQRPSAIWRAIEALIESALDEPQAEVTALPSRS
jgi:hypothetical protein